MPSNCFAYSTPNQGGQRLQVLSQSADVRFQGRPAFHQRKASMSVLGHRRHSVANCVRQQPALTSLCSVSGCSAAVAGSGGHTLSSQSGPYGGHSCAGDISDPLADVKAMSTMPVSLHVRSTERLLTSGANWNDPHRSCSGVEPMTAKLKRRSDAWSNRLELSRETARQSGFDDF